MKIHVSAWHYRLIKLAGFNHAKSLCAYFWITVLSIFFMIIISSMMLLLVGAPLWHWLSPEFPNLLFIIGSGIDILIVALALVGVIKYYEVIPKIRAKLPTWHRKSKVRKEPGLFAQWMWAKHRKICPLITYDRNEKPIDSREIHS